MKIKICGLFREEDIDYVNEAEPDYIGFVFAPSRRRVSPEKAAELRARLSDKIIPVGVFVNAPVYEIAECYNKGIIAIAQLHGGEDAAYIDSLKEVCAVPLIQVIKSNGIIHDKADYILFDNDTAGSGKVFDWNLLANQKYEKKWFLAGGIDMRNIDRAVKLGPDALDVSSGAESGGVKDRSKIAALVERAHSAGNSEF